MPRNDTKAYASVIARIPQDLADQVKQYASQHRCSVSELLREGLEMRLDAEVPGRFHPSSSAPGGEVVHEVVHAVNALAPMLRAAVQDTVRETVTEVVREILQTDTSVLQTHEKVSQEVLHGHTSPSQPHAATQKGHTAVVHQHTLGRHHSTKVIQEVLPHDTAGAPVSPHGAGFDTTRFCVGELCPQRHRYQDTAGSLRYVKGDQDCVTCHSLRSKRYNAKKAARRTAAQPQDGEADEPTDHTV